MEDYQPYGVRSRLSYLIAFDLFFVWVISCARSKVIE